MLPPPEPRRTFWFIALIYRLGALLRRAEGIAEFIRRLTPGLPTALQRADVCRGHADMFLEASPLG